MLASSSFGAAITERNYVECTLNIQGQEVTARTHKASHAEEFRSMDYVEKFGDDEFVERCAIDGVLYFGVSPPGQRSLLDEHAWFSGEKYVPRIPKESCISLTAQYLKSTERGGGSPRPITSFPAIRREVEYLTRTDLSVNEGNPHFMYEFPYVVKALHNRFPDEPEFVRRWLCDGMNAKLDSDWGADNFTFFHAYFLMARTPAFAKQGHDWRREWLEAGMAAVEHDQRQFQSARGSLRNLLPERAIQLRSPQGETITFAWAESDNEKFNSAARSLGYQLLLQITDDGHMQLYSDYRVHGGRGINLDRVAERLQLAEQEAQVQHGDLDTLMVDNPALLRREGFPYWGSVWYYVYGMLLNGSLTRSAVPCSHLSHEEVFLLVQRALIEDGYRVL